MATADIETHIQVGTGKRLVREDGTDMTFGWIQKRPGSLPGPVSPPAIEVVVVVGPPPDLAQLGVASLRDVYPDPAGFRVMTIFEQAIADAAALTEARSNADAAVDEAVVDLEDLRAVVQASTGAFTSAVASLKGDIASAGTPAAAHSFSEGIVGRLNAKIP